MAPGQQAARRGAASGPIAAFFAHAWAVYLAAGALRLVLLLYGLWQDAHSPLKYTDIDYVVFTDAARFAADGISPYARETYRYTPLLAWLLLPTAATSARSPLWTAACFSSGKVLFAASDLVAGWFLVRILTMPSSRAANDHAAGPAMDAARARRYAAIWLLNPMVATISTRGSSEGLLGVLVAALLWAVLARRVDLAGLLLGFGVHFKIYPFIYAPAIVWWMDEQLLGSAAGSSGRSGKGKAQQTREKKTEGERSASDMMATFLTPARLRLAVVSLATFSALNVLMLSLYGNPFLQHTFFHHVTRIDHRHNFSPYNIQLYLVSALPPPSSPSLSLRAESFAFLPQLLLSTVLIPLAMAKKNLASTMLAQTFAFVTFNKVCTSQYFLWYMVLLPLYLPRSSFLRGGGRLGVAALATWVAAQALWLQQAYALEFLGQSTFAPGLWLASLAFFAVNCWILGVIIGDVASPREEVI